MKGPGRSESVIPAEHLGGHTTVDGNDERRARLSCIHHLPQQVPYREIAHQPIVLPEREHKPDYMRTPVPNRYRAGSLLTWG